MRDDNVLLVRDMVMIVINSKTRVGQNYFVTLQ